MWLGPCGCRFPETSAAESLRLSCWSFPLSRCPRHPSRVCPESLHMLLLKTAQLAKRCEALGAGGWTQRKHWQASPRLLSLSTGDSLPPQASGSQEICGVDGRAEHAQRRLPFRGHCRDEDTAGCRPWSWCQEGLGLQKHQREVGPLLAKKMGSKKPQEVRRGRASPDHFNLTPPLHRCKE